MLKNLLNLIRKKQLFLCGLLLIILFFTLDIWTKRISFLSVDLTILKTSGIDTYIKVNNYFNIVKVINTGVSFGLFNSLEYGQYILSSITLSIIIFLFFLFWKVDKKYNLIVYSLIIAGGLGNLYDRLIYGGVFDFLDFHIGDYHWPAFNLADSIICIGVFMIIFEDIIKYFRKHQTL